MTGKVPILLCVDPEATDTWYQDAEMEKEELSTWAMSRWGPGGAVYKGESQFDP
jgi:hypothetical protein